MTSFPSEFAQYVGRVRQFERIDWAVYVAWVGLMLGWCLRRAASYSWATRTAQRSPPSPGGCRSARSFSRSASRSTRLGTAPSTRQKSRAPRAWCTASPSCAASRAACFCAGPIGGTTSDPGARAHAALALVQPDRRSLPLAPLPAQILGPREMWSHVGILAGHSIMMTAWWVGSFKATAASLKP